MKFLKNIPSYLFFTGKGGVGKTSISCATAIRLAELGKRVLLVSTDPASNVGQVFDQTIGNTIQPVTAVPDFRLWRSTRRTPPSNTAPESLILLKVFCLMTLLTASVNSFQELVRQRLLRSTSLLAY
nr:Arsenical pump-driving ATPase [Klebsiella pneumoniae]